MRRLILTAALAIGIAGPLAPVAAFAADMPVPAPMAMPEDNLYALAVVPDLLATINRVEAVVAMFNQGKGAQLKDKLGAMLGDPGLANFAGKPVIVVVGPGAPTPSFALLVPANNPQAYLDAGVNFGMLLGKAVDGIAVLTQTPDGEILGEKIAKNYAAVTKQLPKSDMRLVVAPDKLVTTYGGMLGMMAQMAAAQNPAGPEAAKITALQIAGLMAVIGDIASVQIDLSLDQATISEDFTITAKAGSELAKALVAPPAPVGQRAAARMTNQPSLMAMSGRFNYAGLSSYAATLLRSLQAKPEGQGLISDELIGTVENFGAGLSGDSAFRMVSSDARPIMWEGLYAVTDAVKAERYFEQIIGLMSGPGPLGDAYRNMGITTTLTKGARTSASGVPVHAVAVKVDESKIPAEQSAQIVAMSSYELAVTKGWVVMAQDATSVDALIAGTGKGMTTQAEKALGAGRNFYADVDFIGLVRAFLKLSGTGLDAMMPAPNPGAPIISVGATTAGGRMLLETKWPLAPFLDLGNAFRNAGGQRQQPKPEDNPAF